MAPNKTVAKNNSLISSFFKPFTRRNNAEIGDEIVVASRRQPPETTASPAPSQTQTTPTKRGPGRPRKHPSSQSSPSDGTKSPRPRGRPRKNPLSSSPSQSSRSDVSNSPRKRGRPRKSESQQQRDAQLGARESSSPKTVDALEDDPVNGEADVALPSPSRSSAKRRRSVIAVAALSPSPNLPRSADMSAPPPKPPSFDASTEKPPTASFSSISTLTSVPKSSQASAVPVSSSTSSRRIVSDGLQAVTGSDSESDSLEDFNTVYFNKRRKVSQDDSVKVVGSAPTQQPAKKTARLSDQEKSKKFLKTFPPPTKPAPTKNSLASLVADHERGMMSDATIASLESAVEEAKKQEERAREQEQEQSRFDGEALIAAAGSDSEDRERMIMALARTEALHDKNEYYFFLDSEPCHAKSAFPMDSLPDEPWSKIYRNEMSRKQACISGFAGELAAKYALPMSITSWMACQLQYEPSEELCEAYVEILRASGDHAQSISDTWGSLNSIYKTHSLFENNWKDHVKTALPPGLSYMIRLVSAQAPSIDSIVSEAPPHSTCAAFLDLALTNVDDLVKQNTSLTMSIADCIEDMLDALSEESFSKLIPLAVISMFSPSGLPEIARCRAIAALPASTPRAHKIRRRLALEYFSTAEKKGIDPPSWPKSIIRTLKTDPRFHVSESTDYPLVMSLLTVLDIAIDAGWTDYSLFASREPVGVWGERAPPTEAENRHNKQIDSITDALKAMVSRIRDAGTSHLRRTETKSLIEVIMARLQFGVRSRVRPAKGIFDGDGGGMLRQATFNAGGFGRKAESRSSVDATPVEVSDRGGEADYEGDTGSEKAIVGAARSGRVSFADGS